MTLIDPAGRPVTNIRISLTARCNLNCMYCHREGEKKPKGEMSVDEIAEILRVAASFNIRSVKFTGGEPTLRQDLVEIVRSVPQGMESSMTTNGTLLASKARELKEAGLSRVNISIDSLKREVYEKISGCDRLNEARLGIQSALDAGLIPVKLNVVVLKGINEGEIEDFLSFVRGNRDLVLQLIELMPSADCGHHFGLNNLQTDLEARSTLIITRRMHHRKKFCLDGAEVEIVRPLHNTEFCSSCNRIRVTSDGKLKPCLLRTDNHVDIRGRRGKDLEDLFIQAVSQRKPYYQ
jgi:cyclic pyranopterin phosphate synthase